MYEARQIAAKFLERSPSLTPIQLIKLTYITHGWHLAIIDQPLIKECIVAYQYGPTIIQLYNELKRGNVMRAPQCKLDKLAEGVLRKTWEEYGKFTGIQLSSITHQEGSPWWTAWEIEGGKYRVDYQISDQLIKNYYREKFHGA